MTSEERASEQRYRPDVLKAYEGEGITVSWEPSLCIHVANCIRRLPGVFDPMARPWVKLQGANPDDVAEAVLSCPTGALRFERTDGGPQESPPVPATIQPRLNGPLFVRGEVDIIDARGDVMRTATRVALCRCGHSRNKPYCDLSHRAAEFKS